MSDLARTRTPKSAFREIGLPLVVLLSALTLGYLLKAQCLTHEWDGFQYRSSCYNDIYSLASNRGFNDEPPPDGRIGGALPYLGGNGLDDGPDGDLEYPVGTGYVLMLAALLTRNGPEFFDANAIVLALAGFVAGALAIGLARDRRRLFLVFAAPPLILYSFHNWDLIPTAMVLAALWAWATNRPILTAVWLGIGAATKVYPGILLPAFLLAEGRRTRKFPWRMIAASAAAFVAMNLPIAIANVQAWLFPYRFQGARFPNFETHWYFLYRHFQGVGGSFWSEVYPRLTSVLSALLFVVGMVVLVRRENRRETVRPVTLAFMLIIVWLLTAKVYSPQFSLWLLPFFAFVAVPVRTWVAFVLTDAAVWAAISFYFLSEQGTASSELRLWLVEVATLVRYGALVWLLRSADRVQQDGVRAEPSVSVV